MSRTSNTLRNARWGLFQKVVILVMPFVTRTALIKVLGADYLGLSSLFTSVLSLLSLAELGVSNAIISAMYKPIAEKDTELICALMNFYRKAYYFIGVVVTTVGLAILPFIPNFISGSVPSDINLYALYIIYLINNAISYFLFAYKNCLFIAHQRNDINSKIQTLIIFLQNVVQLVLLITFRSYYCYAIVIPVCSIAINITTAYFSSKAYPEYSCRGKLPIKAKENLKKRVLGLLLGRISATIRGSIDSLFISFFFGLTMVAMYANYLYIVTAVVGIIQILENSLIAGVGNSLVLDSVKKNHNDFLKFTFFLQWIVGWCSICILCLEQPFMGLWVGKEYMLKDLMAVLCAIYLFINCICLIRSIYTQALGMWWQLRYLSVIDIFVNVFLNYTLGKLYGAYGILAATIVDIAFVSIPWTTYYLFRDYFGLKLYWNYMLLYIKYFLISVLAGGITLFVCSKITISSGIIKLIANGLVCIVIPNAIYLAIYNRNLYFKEAVVKVRRIMDYRKRGISSDLF